jgi:hypothetical protein
MEVRGFTSPKHRAAFQPTFESALFYRAGPRPAGNGGIHQLELKPIACAWLIRFDLLIL